MRAVAWAGPDVLDQLAVPDAERGEGRVLVRVDRVGICGSDVSILRGKHARARPGIILGHEFSGTVADAGGRRGLEPGDRVTIRPLISCADRDDPHPCRACRSGQSHVCARLGLYGVDEPGGLADLVAVRPTSVYPVDSCTPAHLEALAEPLAVAVHAVVRSPLQRGDRVAVFGGGPIGLLTALVARHQGAAEVVVVERNAWRADVARRYGFVVPAPDRDPLSLISERTEGDGADVVFDAAGHPAVAAATTRAARIQGTIMIVGVYAEPAAVDLRALNFAEQQIVGTRVYAPEDFQTAVDLLADDALELATLPTRTFGLSRSADAFAAAAAGSDSMKVFIAPGEDA